MEMHERRRIETFWFPLPIPNIENKICLFLTSEKHKFHVRGVCNAFLDSLSCHTSFRIVPLQGYYCPKCSSLLPRLHLVMNHV
jgi:hypothetical protein